jgi:hypothetical protein
MDRANFVKQLGELRCALSNSDGDRFCHTVVGVTFVHEHSSFVIVIVLVHRSKHRHITLLDQRSNNVCAVLVVVVAFVVQLLDDGVEE